MTIDQAFKNLLDNWQDQDQKFKTKYKVFKSRYLNLSGINVKNVSQDKMREMLLISGYKEKWSKPKRRS
jgi:trans-2-enoyl-CoA reductase